MNSGDFLKKDFSVNLSDFVLLKSIFNKSLYDAIMSMDESKIMSIIKSDYAYEVSENFIKWEPLNLEELKKEFVAQCNDEEYLKRFL